MDEVVRKDALRIINDALDILNRDTGMDIVELKNLSNHTIHNASLFQDDCSISIAVLVYSLAKIMERKGYDFKCAKIIKLMEQLQKELQTKSAPNFKPLIKKLFVEIEKNDVRIKTYTDEVLTKAHLKKACKLCEHGLTAARASEVLGVSQWDTMNYLGKTGISDHKESITDIRSRLKFARALFSR